MDELLAKSQPRVTLIDHLIEVATVGKAIAGHLHTEEPVAKRALLACAIHDFGKAAVDFQEHVRGQRKRAYPHALAALPIALACEMRSMGRPTLASAAVLSHHSSLTGDLYRGYDATAPPAYHPLLGAFIADLLRALGGLGLRGLPPAPVWQQLARESPSALLDQRASGGPSALSLRGYFRSLPPEEFAEVKTILQLADWLASGGTTDASSVFLVDGQRQVDRYIQAKGFQLRRFQDAVRECAEKRLYLRAPTGTGKTEALLAWGASSRRLLYFLPTQATVNAMWRRLQGVFGPDSVGLVHGKASYVLRAAGDADEVMDTRLLGSVFAKPVVVGTLDQYLLGALHGRHWEQRLTLARRSAVVLDEIHSYEPYTLGLLTEALHRFPPERLAVASATLPGIVAELLGPGQAIEAEPELWSRRRHRLRMVDEPILGVVGPAVQEARAGRRVLVVADTVQSAQETYEAIKEEWPEALLLHARFTLRDRQGRERELERTPPGTIVVATQVIEVSLDLSFDVMFTEFAPVDALVQRMGRVNRIGTRREAPVWVYSQWSRGAERVYGPELLQASNAIAKALPQRPSDRELADACTQLYSEMSARPEYAEELDEGRKTLQEVVDALGCYTISLDDADMQAKFRSRRGGVSIEVLPEAFVEEALRLKEDGEGWRLAELLVPVPIYAPRMQPQMFQPSKDLGIYITSLPYRQDVGLQLGARPGEETSPALVW